MQHSKNINDIRAIQDCLPQTQCTRCGYSDCQAYASAILEKTAPINLCCVGGTQTIKRLAQLLEIDNPPTACEKPEQIRMGARIDESRCVGCTLCIQACPVDAIIGTRTMMHTVLSDWCNGCEKCIDSCPQNCIELYNVSGDLTGWQAWTEQQAAQSKQRYEDKQLRLKIRQQQLVESELADRKSLIEKAFKIARERARAHGITKVKDL